MSTTFSNNWFRVAALKPRLRNHFEVHRQPFRNQLTFLLQDHVNGKFHQFNANAYDIIGRMDGERTVHDIWESANECLGDDAPTQDETIGLLGRLHQADALRMDVTPDIMELFKRARRQKSKRWQKLIASPLAMRIPLLDPDRLLGVLLPWLGPLFSKAGFVVWAIVVGWALLMAFQHSSSLLYEASTGVFNVGNLGLLMLVYPLIKICHELAHAISTRKWGGEVHEIGLTLLVLVPIPYVDASAATVIRSKSQRILVSAAGIMVELFLAAIALFVWLNVEPGLVRLIAFDVMLIGSVSTLLFNGNPLLRFDAYYMLKDALEIPNLASRSNRYLLYLVQRYLFRIEDATSPSGYQGERGWLLGYGVASAAYRVFITCFIILFVAGELFVVGVLLAIWAFATQLGWPVVKAIRWMFFDSALDTRRIRALAMTGSALALTLGIFFFVPVSSSTVAEGVLWLPQNSHVRSSVEGTVREVLVAADQVVSKGQPLLELEAPELSTRVAILEAEVLELKARHRTERPGSSEASVVLEQIAAKDAELEIKREQASELIIRSGSGGRFVVQDQDALPGRLLRQGDRVGFVLDDASMIVRVVIPQDRAGLIRETVVGVEVRFVEAMSRTYLAEISRDVPGAQPQLPSAALGTSGGGSIMVDPADRQGLTPARSVFQFDISLAEEPDAWRIGQRAYVRFDHGERPLAGQWMLLGRQLFLRQFGV